VKRMSATTNRYEWVSEQRRGEAIILQHMALVKRTAVYLRPRVPDYIELNDMVQLGIIGLLEAEKTYDVAQGISFEAYAKIRIRGAIIDEARKLSRISRLALKNLKKHREARVSLEHSLERPPTSREIATHLGISLDEFEHERTHANSFNYLELDQLLESDNFDIEDESSPALDELINDETRSNLAEEIDQLDERKRLILSLYYTDELNLKEIGAIIGVNESRVSQILKAVIGDLRSKLSNRG
jgi:RNA polymerase sigma factor for flagellar operon FliA